MPLGSRSTTSPSSISYRRATSRSHSTSGARASGGVNGLAGQRDVADVRELLDWLDARQNVDRARIGAYAYSARRHPWRAVAEVSFAAIANAITWTDLYRAIVPQNLTKSGAALGYLNATVRYTPELLAYKDDLYQPQPVDDQDARLALGQELAWNPRTDAPVSGAPRLPSTSSTPSRPTGSWPGRSGSTSPTSATRPHRSRARRFRTR